VNFDHLILGVAAVTALLLLLLLFLFLSAARLRARALRADTSVSVGEIVMLRLGRMPAELIVQAAIELHQRGVTVPVDEIADCYIKHGEGRELNATQLATLVVGERADREGTPHSESE
jgi:uncharacterized protein YqfA (UPF0365 family)